MKGIRKCGILKLKGTYPPTQIRSPVEGFPALAGKLCLRLDALPSKNRSPPPRKDNQTTRDRTFICHPEANPISGYRCRARHVLGENGFTRVEQAYGAVDGVLTLPLTEG